MPDWGVICPPNFFGGGGSRRGAQPDKVSLPWWLLPNLVRIGQVLLEKTFLLNVNGRTANVRMDTGTNFMRLSRRNNLKMVNQASVEMQDYKLPIQLKENWCWYCSMKDWDKTETLWETVEHATRFYVPDPFSLSTRLLTSLGCISLKVSKLSSGKCPMSLQNFQIEGTV